MKIVIISLLGFLYLGLAVGAPSLVLISTPVPSSQIAKEDSHESDDSTQPSQPIIYQFDINSNISNRFAKTLITSKVKNPDTKAKEATFAVVLPEKAFISEFVMEIDGKSYKAYVKEKEEAKNIYNAAVQSGQSAGLVGVSARDSNRFTVSVNVEPEKKATFLLTYEELLERRNNQYELVLNIHPGQIVKDLNIEVMINESRSLKFVRTPSLRSGNEISKTDEKLNPNTNIQIIDKSSAIAKFKPDADQQRDFAKDLGGKENDGLAGQFVLQYEVERDPQGGEILLQDGYFVHFVAPDHLEPIGKHIVFVLDTSGSMWGRKLQQLKQAMISILDELREIDSFHIVEFNTEVYVWNTDSQERVEAELKNQMEPFEDLLKKGYPSAVTATKQAIENGKAVIQKLTDEGITNIMSGLETALHLVHLELKKGKQEGKVHQPIIVFLTDGEANVGISLSSEITNIVTKINSERDQVPIFSLSFGDGADRNFLRKLSLKNQGFARHIYEAADSALQLQEFYKQISSPLLSNVNFKYTSNVTDVTRKIFPIYFRGSELVSAGRFVDEGFSSNVLIEGWGIKGVKIITSVVETPVTSLERLWAYLTIKQKLEERELAENKTDLTKEALDLALKYSFVTDVTSLVVVKPNDTSAVNTEDASKPHGQYGQYPLYGGMSVPGMAGVPAPGIPAPGIPLPGVSGVSTVEDDLDYDAQPLIIPHMTVDITTPNSLILFNPIRELPWLTNVTDQNGKLSVNGVSLELGADDSATPAGPCTGTPRNSTETGICTLLRKCDTVFSYLPDFKTYEKFSCQLENKFAGVCCPQIPVAIP